MSDPVVSLRGVTKKFGDLVAVNDANLDVERGELLTLLGPSGCGKTTTLRMIAGFETPTEGTVRINGENMNGVPPYGRDIAMVFQHFALFPHMTVADNVAFGLEMEGVPEDEIDERVSEVLEMVSLPNVGDRYPDHLSGGQQQRIALARALVVEPEVLLLDEPLSSLDKKLREEMRLEIMRLHRELDVTMIYVTHNQSEALSISDRMAVMDDGHIRQVGSPPEVYQEPADEFVADFIGTANLLDGRVTGVDDEDYHLETVQGLDIRAKTDTVIGENGFDAGDDVTVLFRPERLHLDGADAGSRDGADAANSMRGTIREITYLGSYGEYYVELEDGTEIQLSSPVQRSIERSVGDDVTITFQPSAPILLGGS